MRIFVTGMHRAGTHSFAERMAKKHGLLYIEESLIRWDSIEAVMLLAHGYMPDWKLTGNKWILAKTRNHLLDNGFVLQCPGLAAKVEALAQLGMKIYWCTRDSEAIVTSMHNNQIGRMAWHLMRRFHEEYPDDPIWKTLKYEGEKYRHLYFVNYYRLLVKVKQYFLETRFKDMVEVIKLEDRPGYKNRMAQTSAFKNPLRG